jgi:hypothetical protein
MERIDAWPELNFGAVSCAYYLVEKAAAKWRCFTVRLFSLFSSPVQGAFRSIKRWA